MKNILNKLSILLLLVIINNTQKIFSMNQEDIDLKRAIEASLRQQEDPGLKLAIEASLKLQEELEKSSLSGWFYSGNLLDQVIKARNLTIINTEYGIGFAVPDFLKQIIKNNFYHLLSSNQIHPTCGFHAFSNALIIERLINNGQKIDATKIRNAVETFFPELEKTEEFSCLRARGGIEYSDERHIDKLAKKENYKLNAYYILPPYYGVYGTDPNKYSYLNDILRNNPYALSSLFPLAGTDEQIIDSLRKSKVTHFFINLSGHWVLISVIKDKNNFDMIYLDSLNTSIANNNINLIESIKKIDNLIEKVKTSEPGYKAEASAGPAKNTGTRETSSANIKQDLESLFFFTETLRSKI